MSFISFGTSFDQAKERTTVPQGIYTLRVTDYEVREDGSAMIFNCEIEGHSEAFPVRHWVNLPKRDDTPQKIESKLLFAARFFAALGVDLKADGVDPDQLVGKSFECPLIETVNPNNAEQKFNKLEPPRLQAEGNAPKPRAQKRA